MPHDTLEATLRQLQDRLGDLATLNNIVIARLEEATKLLQPLKTVLTETRDAIDYTLALLS